MIKISKGLDLQITGAPEQSVSDGPLVGSVAVVGHDYIGMKPTMSVRVGDRVKLGQVLFSDKKTEGVKYTAPGSGIVKQINRGERRVLQSVVIELEGDEAVEFERYDADKFSELSTEQVETNLIESGMWTAFRTRPFSRVPAPKTTPNSIFVTAIDTNPLAADPVVIVAEHKESFMLGLEILKKLTATVYLCKATDADIPSALDVTTKQFQGCHPAGNAGTHIHFTDPVSQNKTVWTIGYQDVIAIGRLFVDGRLFTDRIVSVAGPRVLEPKLLRTRLGASFNDLLINNQKGENNRIISGSVWNGRKANDDAFAYLGRYHNQVTILEEGNQREFIGWLKPGSNKFSVLNVFTSCLNRSKKIDFTTTTNGSERAMVPVGQFEELMPMDILPTQLLRAIVTGDIVHAMELGCLELDEEDLALCTFACPGKYEYGPILRDNLTRIEKEA